LNGDALNSSGGQPRHEIEAQAGFTKSGLGARLTANWRSDTTVNSGASGALRFSDLTTLNLRLFSNLSAQREWVAAYPILRGTRVTFGVNNLLNSKIKVRDATGLVPVSYQPDYLDPLGRSIRLSVRKVFF
jgi:iron complex outermembrane receptor protein